MLKSQNNVCAICHQKFGGGRNSNSRLGIDHCHTTGKVRGLLCSNCNRGLGMFKDSEERLKNALDYIKRSK